MGFFTLLFVGAIAGWIAERVTRSDHGLLTNIIVGIAGSFVGSALAGTLGLDVRGFLGNLVVAAIGAVLLLWGWRMLRDGRR